jgi:integrase
VVLAAFGSLRFAEMMGLQRRDFDLGTGAVRMDRQAVQPDKGPMFEDDPKSAAGKRPVPLPAFLTSRGPEAPGRFRKSRRAAGIPDLHLHDLQHTGNTLAAETGATLRELMDRMGHGSTRPRPQEGRRIVLRGRRSRP